MTAAIERVCAVIKSLAFFDTLTIILISSRDAIDVASMRTARERVAKEQRSSSVAVAMNDLAWFCARTGEHADEAIALADRALGLEPENYAYIDTAASAHFAAGDAAEAARLEKRALLMRPSDVFMQRQLQRFEAAANQKP